MPTSVRQPPRSAMESVLASEPTRQTRFIKLEDGELVKRAINGNRNAFNELVERYHIAARKKAFAILKDHQGAEDIAQDAFIKAYLRLATIKEPKKFSYWLLRTVQHTALDYRRTLKDPLSLESIREDGFEISDDEQQSLDVFFEDLEEDLRVLQALKRLRKDYREIFELKHLKHKSYREISKELNMSISAVGEKLSRVRQLVRRQLENMLAAEQVKQKKRRERK